MWLLTALSGLKWSVVLPVMAIVTLLISTVTVLIGTAMRSRSAPAREVVFRAGLCLVAVWPILAILIGMVVPESVPAATATLSDPHFSAVDTVRQLTPKVLVPPAAEPVSERVTAPLSDGIEPVSAVAAQPATVSSQSQPSLAPPFSLVPAPSPIQSRPVTSIELPIERQSPLSIPETSAITHATPPTATAAPVVATPASHWWPFELPFFVIVAFRWLVVFWVLGCLVAGCSVMREFIRVWKFQRRLRPCHDESIETTLTEAMRLTGLQLLPKVFVSDCLGSPCTSGVWKPVLILPESMLDHLDTDPAMQLGVLTHECAHIVRRDVAWALLARLVQSVYWWEPGLRRIVRELSHLREEICDNHVLSSSIDVRVYAKALVDFAAAPLFRPLIGVIGMVANDNPLSGRVERLLEDSPDKTTRIEWRSRRGMAYIVLVAFGVIGVIGASSKVAGALARVLLPALDEPESSRDIAKSSLLVSSKAVLQTPIRSSESRVRGRRPTAPPRQPAPSVAADDFGRDEARDEPFAPPLSTVDTEPFAPPLEAGSGTFNPPLPTDFPEPFEAGSGVGNSFTPVPSPVPLYDDAPIAVRPRTQAAPYGTAQPATPSIPQANQPPRMKAVRSTEIINGKPAIVTRMVPIATEEDEPPIHSFPAEEPLSDNLPTPSPVVPMYPNDPTVQEHRIRKMELQLAEDPKLQDGDQVVVAVTHAEPESSLPSRIYLEGLTYHSPKDKPTSDSNERSLDIDPLSDAKPTDVPPAPPAVTPAEASDKPDPAAPPATNTATPDTSGRFLFSGHESTINALTYLQSRGAVTSVTKAEPPTATNNHPKNGSAPIPDEPGTIFRMSLEAVTNNPGQWIGLRCWGRDLPGETPELRLAELTRVLTRWKEECQKESHAYRTRQLIHPETDHIIEEQYAPSDRNLSKLVVTLRIIDNMRYSDVQLIVAACESLQIQTRIITSAQAPPSMATPNAYTSAELTLVYDKKGQKVGNHPVLLAGQATMMGAQVIAEPQFNSVLNRFSLTHPEFHSTLLLKVDPDLPLEKLLAFIARANRAGFKNVELLPREELHVRAGDQFAPLLSDTLFESQPVPVGPSAPLYAPPLAPVQVEPDGDNQTDADFMPTTEDSEPFSALPELMPVSQPARVRQDPLPIPSVTLVREH